MKLSRTVAEGHRGTAKKAHSTTIPLKVCCYQCHPYYWKEELVGKLTESFEGSGFQEQSTGVSTLERPLIR